MAQVRFQFGDQKGIIRNKDMPFGYPTYHEMKIVGSDFSNSVFTLLAKKCFLGQKRCFGVFWAKCEAADLKQRQKIFKMDHRNKIQSLVSPTDDPGDAPDYITEHGPCTCEYGCMCHTAPTTQKYHATMGFPVDPRCI